MWENHITLAQTADFIKHNHATEITDFDANSDAKK